MIKYTLIGDGSSDRTLMKIIDWSLTNILPIVPVNGAFANFSYLRKPPKTLREKVLKAIDIEPCDILFVHRDAEATKEIDKMVSHRKSEISLAVGTIKCKHVPIIPVKMMEAWLFTDELAIRKASGNPKSTHALAITNIRKLEALTNPKESLHDCLRIASGLSGRRLDSFNVNQAVHLVAEYTNDFSKLKSLVAFKIFEQDLIIALTELGYLTP